MSHVNYIDWHVHPFRAERWLEIWAPALERARAFGATTSYLTRSIDDPLHFRQVTFWDDKSDFERYWYSDELARLREEAVNYFNKPVLPAWGSLVADAGAPGPAAEAVAESTGE